MISVGIGLYRTSGLSDWYRLLLCWWQPSLRIQALIVGIILFLFSSSHTLHRLSLTCYDTLQYTCCQRMITELLIFMLFYLSIHLLPGWRSVTIWMNVTGTYHGSLKSPVVTICTTSLTFIDSTFCPHSVFMCFVRIWEQTAINSLYNINWIFLHQRFNSLKPCGHYIHHNLIKY